MSVTIKQIGGRYLWTGISSCNAKDWDGEIVSQAALRADVEKGSAEDKGLWYSHLPLPIGDSPVWRQVVNGMLVEVGYFADHPVAKAVASYIVANPNGFDGKGWGMSIGFRGMLDSDGVYNQIEIRERSVLPLSRAANPYTSFQVRSEDMEQQSKQALDELVKIVNADPEAAEALKGIMGAAAKSVQLDAEAVARKAKPDPEGTDEEVDDEAAEEEVKPKKRGGKKARAQQAVSDDVLKEIVRFVDETLKDRMEAIRKELDAKSEEITKALTDTATAVEAVMDRLEAVEAVETEVQAKAVTPQGIFERMKAIQSATRAEATVTTAEYKAPTPRETTSFFGQKG